MGGTLLLFGYDQLPVILAAEAAVETLRRNAAGGGPPVLRADAGAAGGRGECAPGHGAGSAWRADGGAVRPGPPCGCLDPGPSKGRDSVP